VWEQARVATDNCYFATPSSFFYYFADLLTLESTKIMNFEESNPQKFEYLRNRIHKNMNI